MEVTKYKVDTIPVVGETDSINSQTCQHQWIIDMPSGPSSKGVCRQCGEEKDFMNYIEGSPWGYDVSLEQLSGGTKVLSSYSKGNTDAEDEQLD